LSVLLRVWRAIYPKVGFPKQRISVESIHNTRNKLSQLWLILLSIMSPRKKKRWSASVAKESKKLVNKEDDWKLNGDVVNTPPTRTRKGGHRRPKLVKDSPEVVVVTDARNSQSATTVTTLSLLSDESDIEDSDWTPTNEEDSLDSKEELVGKPSATRVILEVSSVKALMEKTCRCLQCNGSVEVFLRTVCIATSVMVSCKNLRCGFVAYCNTQLSSFHD
jgi:hypothetical protein